mgnify:CR=1 FL=1
MGGAEPARSRSRSLGGLWLCLDLAWRTPDELIERADAVLEALPRQVGALWLRSPRESPARTLVSLARGLRRVALPRGVAVLVGDRVDVALAGGCDGVHLGSHSVSPGEARALFDRAGRPGLVSASAHDRAELEARRDGCDALLVSPVFAVPDKGAALGVEGFAALCALAPAQTIVALGGVDTPERVQRVRSAGAQAIAVRRSVLAPQTTAEVLRACERLANAMDRPGAA